MKLTRAWEIMRKELLSGIRSPYFILAIAAPFLITIGVRGLLGGLFEPEPRLGIVDEGNSDTTTGARALEGIEVLLVDSADELRRQIEANDLDGGLVLPAGFDTAIRAGDQPELRFYLGGESLASNRVIIAITTLDLVRAVAGEATPVLVEVITLGEETLDLMTRLLALIVMMVVALAGVIVTATAVLQEKTQKTLSAMLVSPCTMSEVLLGKGALGFALALVVGVATLALNQALGGQPIALLLTVALGALMMAEVGLILGCWAKDANTLFTAWKTGGIVLFFPALFFIWPSLPQWIAYLGPTHYFLKPTFEIAVSGATLGDVWLELAAGLGICIALLPLVAKMGRRVERKLDAAV